MNRYIFEPKRHVPVVESCDVAVVGGGIAGVAAALAARKTRGRIARLDQVNLQSVLQRQGVIIDRRI